MANHSSAEFALQRVESVAASNDANQLDSAGEAILKPTSCCRRSDRGVRSGSSSLP
jgi:hypothetical protein